MSSTAKDSVTAERIIEDYAKVLEHNAVLGGILYVHGDMSVVFIGYCQYCKLLAFESVKIHSFSTLIATL